MAAYVGSKVQGYRRSGGGACFSHGCVVRGQAKNNPEIFHSAASIVRRKNIGTRVAPDPRQTLHVKAVTTLQLHQVCVLFNTNYCHPLVQGLLNEEHSLQLSAMMKVQHSVLSNKR